MQLNSIQFRSQFFSCNVFNASILRCEYLRMRPFSKKTFYIHSLLDKWLAMELLHTYSMYISISHPCDFQSLLSHLCTEPTTIRFFHPKLHNTLCIINKCLRVNERMSECAQVSHIRALEVMLMHTNCVSYLFPHIIVIFFIFVRFFLRNAKIYDNERLNVKSSQLRQCRKKCAAIHPTY